MTPKVTLNGPNLIQNEAKWDPNPPPVTSRWPRRPQDGYKRFQGGHKDAPRGPQEAPIWPKECPRWPRGTPRWLQEAPRWPHKALTCPQDGPKRAPWGANWVPKWCPKWKYLIFKKPYFSLRFSIKMTFWGGQNGAILGPCDVKCMT